ncbi:Nucleotidyltransferase domain protein (plasmid) [Neomoorella glycerini]|uniref:Nucleotidyltransferase domain protein n=2 Tax=Neomoorella glycerini TaxID=55779 RepID=A0A6I5ZX19_9FIRM|nr:Nucleotidyltransferase domain protein [Moorella glycerini]
MNEKIVYSMVKRIQEKFSPEKIIVFGSWARGEAGPDSDVDILVIMDCTREQKREIQAAIRKELREFRVPKDIVIASPEDINKYKDAWWTVYHPALAEGKVLYEQQ